MRKNLSSHLIVCVTHVRHIEMDKVELRDLSEKHRTTGLSLRRQTSRFSSREFIRPAQAQAVVRCLFAISLTRTYHAGSRQSHRTASRAYRPPVVPVAPGNG